MARFHAIFRPATPVPRNGVDVVRSATRSTDCVAFPNGSTVKRTIPSVPGFALACVIGAGELFAQDVQPRVYTPAPVGINLVTLGYSYSSGAVLYDKTIPIEDASARVHSLSAAYSRSIGLFGSAGRIDLAVPFVSGEWVGELKQLASSASRTGFGDPVLRVALFPVGAPALSRQEFAGFKPRTTLGVTVRLHMPLGQYDPDKLINLGSNRWVLSPQVGVSHPAGRFLLEAYAGAWFFSDNDEFLGTKTFSQDPLYTIQVHVGYSFPKGIWIAVSSRQSLGGATRVDRGEKTDPESNNRLGLTFNVPLGKGFSLKLAATTGVTATVGNDYDTFVAALQKAW